MVAKKYFSEEEKAAARRARDLVYKKRKYWAQKAVLLSDGASRVTLQDEASDPRPPVEVVLEHELRCQLAAVHNSTTVVVGDLTSFLNGDPLPQYATNYPGIAMRKQAAFRVVG